MISEAEFQAALERALNAPHRATRVWRVNAGDTIVETAGGGRRRIRGARKGSGDLAGFVRGLGLHVEVECKRHDGRVSAAQRRHGRVLREAGCVWLVVRGPAPGVSLEAAVEAALRDVDLEISRARSRILKEVSCPSKNCP